MERRARLIAAANEEAIEAWDGVLFDRYVRFREIVVGGLAAHGEEALRHHPPRPGERALDIGCGFGDTTLRIAELVGSEGEAVGVDAAPRFIATARAEARAAGVANVRFEIADVEAGVPGAGYEYAFSRFGTMFFANPVAALRNVRGALVPGGRLSIVVWRRKSENDWVHRAERAVEELLPEPKESDAPTCGPGPFSMADADTVSQILLASGFEEVTLRRCDIPVRIGRDLDEAVEFVTSLGPAGELIRLAGMGAERMRPRIKSVVRQALAALDGGDGLIASASSWIVGATAPQWSSG
jgi:ubiquinone/menaquinone biosynthesis C-methylase UbiE